MKDYMAKNKEKKYKYWRASYFKLKKPIFDQYDSKCAECGYTDIRVLQIDHKYGGGRQERLRLKPWGTLKRALEYPDEYQLLCANCHFLKTSKENNRLWAYANDKEH